MIFTEEGDNESSSSRVPRPGRISVEVAPPSNTRTIGLREDDQGENSNTEGTSVLDWEHRAGSTEQEVSLLARLEQAATIEINMEKWDTVVPIHSSAV